MFFCPVLETNTTPKGDLVKCRSGYKTYTIQHTRSVCCRNRTLIGFTCTKACLAPLNLRVSFKSVPRCNRYNFGVINGVSYLMWACVFYIVLETSISLPIVDSYVHMYSRHALQALFWLLIVTPRYSSFWRYSYSSSDQY